MLIKGYEPKNGPAIYRLMSLIWIFLPRSLLLTSSAYLLFGYWTRQSFYVNPVYGVRSSHFLELFRH